MSLFHKSGENAGAVTFSDQEAAIALLFLIVTADGKIAPEEEQLVVTSSNRMKLLRKQSIDQFNEAVWKVRDAIEKSGRDAVFSAAVAGLPPELGKQSTRSGRDIIFADGTVVPEENDFLRRVQEALKVPDELATKVIEVMRVKNSG